MKIQQGRGFKKYVFCAALVALAVVRPAFALTTNFFEGFEVNLTNWISSDNNLGGTPAYWGRVNSGFGGEGTHSGNVKAYCAAAGFTGSTTSPLYRDDMSAQLARSVDLTGYTDATLSFWYKLPSIETCCDSAEVRLDDTMLWSTVTAQTNWTLVTLPLSDYVGAQRTLKFVFNTDSSVTGEGWYLDDITLTDAFTPGPPPINDNFTAAINLVGAIGSRAGTTKDATAEANEPAPGNSVWYRWTAITNGPVTFRTGGSAIDTLLCIYTGSTLGSLAMVACDDNSDTNKASLISFNAVRGVVYRISVRGATNASGFVLLHWDQPSGIGTDLLPDLFIWTNTPNSYLYGWYVDRAEETQPGRTLLRVSTATPNVGTGNLELRGSSDAPGVYQRIYRSDGSSRDRYAGTFTFHPGHGHLHFDNWINLHLRQVLPGDGVGDIVASGDKTSFAILDLIRFTNSAPTEGSYGGGLVQGLTVGWADVYSADLLDQWIDITGVASGRYWLEAIVDPANSILELNESNNLQRILINLVQPDITPPSNDNFTNATVIAGVTAGYFSVTTNATRETALGEPQHFGGNTGAASLWWRWTAPSNLAVNITTLGSSFDTVLAVYTGARFGALTTMASDNNGGGGVASKVTFSAIGGTTYHIAVDGWNGAAGSLQLNFNPAWNDAIENPLPVEGYAGTARGSTRGATRQSGEPAHAAFPGTNSIWYRWTAETNAPYVFDTQGSTFDTLLAVYTGDVVSNLVYVASDNNSGGTNGTSKLTFNSISGTTYRIAVAGANNAAGVVQLNWTGPTLPIITAQPASSNLLAGGNAIFRLSVTGSGPFTYQWQHAETNLLSDTHVQNATASIMRVSKITRADAGVYRCIVSNPWGSVTSAPANLIVLDNPRVVYVSEVQSLAGGTAVVPIQMQALGDENHFAFSLTFDPNILSNPRFVRGADTSDATLTLITNMLSSGRLGVVLTLPPGRALSPGEELHLARATFDVNPVAPEGTTTFVGFGDSPVAKGVRTTNSLTVTTLFAAGTISLRAITVSGEHLPDGRFRLTLSGLAGRSYVMQSSTNLTEWTDVTTMPADHHGTLQFTDLETLTASQKFYRALLSP